MVKKCIVCGTPQEKGSIYSFHKFPKNEEERQSWINACNLQTNDFRECWLICSKHFTEDDYDSSVWPTQVLLKNALPSSNKDYQIANTGKMDAENLLEYKENFLTGHDYCLTCVPKVEQFSSTDTGSQIIDAVEGSGPPNRDSIIGATIFSPSCHASALGEGKLLEEAKCTFHTEHDSLTHVSESDSCSSTDECISQTILCSPSWAVRHIGNLLPEHFSTPKKAKTHLDFVKQTMEKQRRKVKILQQQKRRLGKQISSIADLIEHLKEQKSLSDEAADTILEYLSNIKCSQK